MELIASRYIGYKEYEKYGDKVREQFVKWHWVVVDAAVVFTLLLMLLVFKPFGTVSEGHRGVVTEFGRIASIREPGLQFYAPWQNMSEMRVLADSAELKNAEGGTRDTQPVWVDLVVRYQILPARVEEIYRNYSKTGDLDNYVQTATAEAFKAVTARYSAEELIAKRSDVSQGVLKAIDDRTDKFGINVLSVDMTGFKFSDSYMKAINEKVTEEQKKKAEENKLQRVMVEQQQNVEKSRAEAQSARAIADGEAYALTTVARARADALRIENAALRESKDVLDLRRIEVEMRKADKWDGKLPQNLYGSAPIPWMTIPQGK